MTTPAMRAWEWATARLLVELESPAQVVAWLRLTQPCRRCGARPQQECIRGLGEVRATHLQRGA